MPVKYIAQVYGKNIQSDTMQGLHIHATNVANTKKADFDDLDVLAVDGIRLKNPVVYRRTNRKMPGGAIVFGKWERIK
jgi:hypothetical protein